MNAPRLWGGEGNRTRTGAIPSMSLFTRDGRMVSRFRSDADWFLAQGHVLDAPEHIASGGIQAYTFASGVVLFASVERP